MDPIVFLPGIPGSTLDRPGPLGSRIPVWGLLTTLPGGVVDLGIKADGSDVAPTAVSPVVVAENPPGTLGADQKSLLGYYGTIRQNLQTLGWTFIAVPCDWRRSPASQADALHALINARLGTGNFHLVSHSQGSRFGRWLYRSFDKSGEAARIRSVIEIAPPVLGSWSIVKALLGWDTLVTVLSTVQRVRTVALTLPISPILTLILRGSPRDLVLRTMWTLPGIRDMLPSDAGNQTDFRRGLASQVWNRDWWGFDGAASQAQLDVSHLGVVNYLGIQIPKEKHWVLFSTGFPTVETTEHGAGTRGGDSFFDVITNAGDGRVSAQDLGGEDVNYFPVFGDHSSIVGGVRTAVTIDAILRGVEPDLHGGGGDVIVNGPIVPSDTLPPALTSFQAPINNEIAQLLSYTGIISVAQPSSARTSAPAHCPDPVRDARR